jgi:hypothetical protein
MTLMQIQKDYYLGKYSASFPSDQDYIHVVDEDQTVRWNKEQQQRLNKQYELEVKVYRESQCVLNNKLRHDMILVGMSSVPALTKEQVEKVYDFTYVRYHAYMSEFFAFYEEYLELLQEITKKEI